ncbi:SlyX family protein [Pseudoduganella chitinolytica]|uniref:SlyX family protein n=1 Tax=Pseudoduganella chitinolytica TaxID=34070 RepID=A0ABY8B8A4_9BURK|nr:SlyX family protein [Pseudoduganella chitinolytica]WEF32162.1 SlyX family protein [Pseudoduganella chitinolytica]
MTDAIDNRLIDIEIKLAHQEHLVESLNERIYEQQQQIDKLENLIAAMAERIRTRDAAQAPINERPPHY